MAYGTPDLRLLGDPAPPSVAGYYAALDEGNLDAAAACFALDAVFALPPRGGNEVDPRLVIDGQADVRKFLHSVGVWSNPHRLVLCAVDGSSCLVEGLVEEAETRRMLHGFATSVQLDASGQIARYLSYQYQPARPPQLHPELPRHGDACAVVQRYLDALDDGRFDAAAACFSEDVVYSHPPYQHSGIHNEQRIEFRGRDALLAGFKQRGPTSYGHRIEICLQRGPHCLLEMLIFDLPEGGQGSAIASLSLDEEGTIARYVAFYCEPAIARR